MLYQPNSIVFEIWGENFYQGAFPVVTLGGIFDLTVDEAYTDDGFIIATLPSIKEKNFEFGDYRLVVSTCHDSARKDKYCKDHGPHCKCKYCKEHCSKCNDKRSRGYERKCRCKDRYSLTIADPSGQIGTIGSVIVATDGKQISTKEFEGYSPCDQGYSVTGGGFKSINLKIVESRPDGNGWYVLGRIEFYKEMDPALTVHAVCAKIK